MRQSIKCQSCSYITMGSEARQITDGNVFAIIFFIIANRNNSVIKLYTVDVISLSLTDTLHLCVWHLSGEGSVSSWNRECTETNISYLVHFNRIRLICCFSPHCSPVRSRFPAPRIRNPADAKKLPSPSHTYKEPKNTRDATRGGGTWGGKSARALRRNHAHRAGKCGARLQRHHVALNISVYERDDRLIGRLTVCDNVSGCVCVRGGRESDEKVSDEKEKDEKERDETYKTEKVTEIRKGHERNKAKRHERETKGNPTINPNSTLNNLT